MWIDQAGQQIPLDWGYQVSWTDDIQRFGSPLVAKLQIPKHLKFELQEKLNTNFLLEGTTLIVPIANSGFLAKVTQLPKKENVAIVIRPIFKENYFGQSTHCSKINLQVKLQSHYHQEKNDTPHFVYANCFNRKVAVYTPLNFSLNHPNSKDHEFSKETIIYSKEPRYVKKLEVRNNNQTLVSRLHLHKSTNKKITLKKPSRPKPTFTSSQIAGQNNDWNLLFSASPYYLQLRTLDTAQEQSKYAFGLKLRSTLSIDLDDNQAISFSLEAPLVELSTLTFPTTGIYNFNSAYWFSFLDAQIKLGLGADYTYLYADKHVNEDHTVLGPQLSLQAFLTEQISMQIKQSFYFSTRSSFAENHLTQLQLSFFHKTSQNFFFSAKSGKFVENNLRTQVNEFLFGYEWEL